MKGILWAVSAACLLSSFSHIAIAQNPTKPKDNITINLDYSLDLLEFKIEPKDSYRYIKAPLTNKPTEATQALFKKYLSIASVTL